MSLDTTMTEELWRAYADASQLVSAIVNLCVNSRDAMPDGGSLVVATSNIEFDERYAEQHADARAGQFICIAVTDSGVGMSPEVVARAFDPFYTTKPVGQGTGLGLSQVYGFVKQSGGHINIHSEPGIGTTIRIYLPRFFGPDEPVAIESGVQLNHDLNVEVILVVEDEERVRNMTVEALQGLGYVVIAATGPQGGALDFAAITPGRISR